MNRVYGQSSHRQRLAATATANLRGTYRNEVCYYYQRSTLIQDLAGQVHKHRYMAGPNGVYVVLGQYHLGFHTSQLHPD
jgi:hypothetical protein